MPLSFSKKRPTSLVVAGLLVALGTIFVAQPSQAGDKKSEKHSQKNNRDHGQNHGKGKNDGNKKEGNKSKHFAERQRTVIFDYYNESFKSGNCPPGLEKKNNSCTPPGLSKKWVVGRTLPHDIVRYELPAAVVVQLGPPPIGHRYVRVASDILLIAEGTGMIIDALQNLSQ